MNIKAAIKKSLRVTLCVVFALILILTGTVIILYSPWSQELIRQGVVKKLSQGSTRLDLASFRLHFPLDVEAGGVALVTDGDTLMAAEHFNASVALMPLLAGKAEITEARATGARYNMGAPDSLMYMTIAADSLGIRPASVQLADMAISLDEATIRGGRLGIFLRPDTSTAPKPATPPTKMSIALGKIRLEDFDYTMRLMPSIDTLSAHVPAAMLTGGHIDLLGQTIKLGQFTGSGLDARYIAPDSAAILSSGPYPTPEQLAIQARNNDTVAPWTVQIDTIGFSRSRALYATAGVEPLPGLDFTYIQVSDVELGIHDFYNQQTTVRLPLNISGKERCGVDLDIVGELDIDSVALDFKSVSLTTVNGTNAAFSGKLGMGDMLTDPSLPLQLRLHGVFDPTDLQLMFPAFTPYLAGIPTADDVQLTADLDGTTGRLDIQALDLQLNGCVNLGATGYVENFMNPDDMGADITLRGNIINVNSFKNRLLDPATAKTIKVPPMTLNGHVTMHGMNVNGNLAARTGKGALRMLARWNGNAEAYKVDLGTTVFPIQAFMPLLGVGPVTATVKVDGHGYDPFSARTAINADLDLKSLEYMGATYTNVTGNVKLADGRADVALRSTDPNAELTLNAAGNLDGKVYNWTADIDGTNIDLFALKLATEPSSLELTANAQASIGPGMNNIDARLVLTDLFYRSATGTIGLSDVNAHLNGTDSLVNLSLTNRDLYANFTSPLSLQALATRFGSVGTLVAEQIGAYSINIDTLQRTLPPFNLTLTAGSSNLINDVLAPSKMAIRSLNMSADNDSTLTILAGVRRLQTASMLIDSIYFETDQFADKLILNAGILNRPGNMDEWHSVNFRGIIDRNDMVAHLHQENVKGKTGFDVGMALTAQLADSTFILNVRPYEPIIGYQPWSVNEDNFISYNLPDKHIDANLHMHGANSSLAIFTEHPEGEHNHDHEGDQDQEDLVIQLTDIHIQDWIAFNPFAPPVKGDVSADVRLNTVDNHLLGRGDVAITDMFYGREKVADMKAVFDVTAAQGGALNAKADVYVNGEKTMTLAGALNDSTATSPLAMDFSMIRFPLATANPFIPATVGKLRGVLNGTMKVSGTSDRPILDGWIDFDSTAVKLAITGQEYTFSEVRIPVDSSRVTFSDFEIMGCNANPLHVNGNVDISDMADMKLDLSLKADNMQLVNSTRAARGADVFGKAFINLDANARGSMSLLRVNADLTILPETNVTYVMPEATSMLSSQSNADMVKFVNFTDSAAVALADSITTMSTAMFLDASLNINEGAIINVYLSADGKNRVQLQPQGTVDYSMSPLDLDGSLTGRIIIDKGFVRYTPPLISEKYFTFQEGSYVAFNGDMMNPTLNIHAVDVLKANVTQEGQNSRLVDFDVSLDVTGTLNRMNVVFDLSTNDDITVANELETMSPEQRASQAMNMLLYNVYTGPGTRGNASLSGNPLFSFLESQLNTWAANNIKGVDISFGIDQYNRTVDGSSSNTMSYSYQVSKSLFNDRFKIVVGGNYSTDANADENFSQNLINDISFEYYLNAARSMYLRLFRHTGYESILEGEITQTGVGFVYRRKLQRIGDMFLPVKVAKAREEARERKAMEKLNIHHTDSKDEK